jgi:alpha-ketoglutarate-dependent taurine dioxygenase
MFWHASSSSTFFMHDNPSWNFRYSPEHKVHSRVFRTMLKSELEVHSVARMNDSDWKVLFSRINEQGWVLLRQQVVLSGPVESLRLLGTRFGEPHFHKLSDEYGIHPIRYIPGFPEYANANVEFLGLHTDGSFEPDPPVFMIIYCETPAETGGHSRLASGDELYWHLHNKHPDHLRALSRPAAFTITRDDRKAQRSVFTSDGDMVRLAYRDGTDICLEIHPEAQDAFQYVRNWLADEANYIDLKLQPGEVLILDNTRMLHGRTTFPRESSRSLHGLWCKGTSPYNHLLSKGIVIALNRVTAA